MLIFYILLQLLPHLFWILQFSFKFRLLLLRCCMFAYQGCVLLLFVFKVGAHMVMVKFQLLVSRQFVIQKVTQTSHFSFVSFPLSCQLIICFFKTCQFGERILILSLLLRQLLFQFIYSFTLFFNRSQQIIFFIFMLVLHVIELRLVVPLHAGHIQLML